MINEACTAIIVFQPIALKSHRTLYCHASFCLVLPCIAWEIIVVWQIYRRRAVLGLGSYHTPDSSLQSRALSKKLPSASSQACKKLIQTNGSDCKFSSNFFSLAKIVLHIGHGRVTVNADNNDDEVDEDEDELR